eukprot:9488382-Pyramimonas_sp.AAC.3
MVVQKSKRISPRIPLPLLELLLLVFTWSGGQWPLAPAPPRFSSPSQNSASAPSPSAGRVPHLRPKYSR